MIQIPQLDLTPAKTAKTGQPSAKAEGDEFSRILQAQGPEKKADKPAPKADEKDELPPEIVAEALQQLEDGVPLEQVLVDLRENLQAFVAGKAAPAAEEAAKGLAANALSDEALLARLGLRPGINAQDKAARLDLTDELKLDPELDVALEPELKLAKPDRALPLPDAAPGKDRLALLGRLQVAEPGAKMPDFASNLAQATPLKGMELPAMLKDLAANTAGQAKPTGEALSLPVRVGEQGWGQALAQRVMWMAGRDQQTAEIKLNPAHLGPLEVKLSLKHDQASVTLLANNAAVKEALEQALPRLRDMFSQQDIQLVQADVGQRQDPRQAGAGEQMADQQGSGGHGHDASDDSVLLEEGEVSDSIVQQGLGLLDAYA